MIYGTNKILTKIFILYRKYDILQVSNIKLPRNYYNFIIGNTYKKEIKWKIKQNYIQRCSHGYLLDY